MLTREFMLAGRAVFTVEVPASFRTDKDYPEQATCHPHYTFKIKNVPPAGEHRRCFMAFLLADGDKYFYMGIVKPYNGEVIRTPKSRYGEESWPWKILTRVLIRVWRNEQIVIEDKGFVLKPSGQCARCGRELTHPRSLISGLGPECEGRV